ncbi:hypothetical protein Aperf_G00000005370 [Anoplocephala perfoliata]
MSAPTDGLYTGANTSGIRSLDKLNIDLSDLIDDLVCLANSDTANPADAGSTVIFSNLSQRIASLRTSIQEAKELCRPTPRVPRPSSAAPSSTVSTPRATPSIVTKVTPAPPVIPEVNHSLNLFQTACELDPEAQQKLFTAVATACVMSSDEKSVPPMWTAVQVSCCQSKVFRGYICGVSDSPEATVVLCSVPEGKVIFILGWAIEKMEILEDYPPLPEEMKAKLEAIYTSSVEDPPIHSGTDAFQTDSLERRRKSVLSHFGPLVAKVSEDDKEKIVLYDGLVTLLPPYLPSSCQSSNPSLLKRVQGMLMQIDERPR